MKKEDILKASREENKNKDLAEIEIENKGVKFAALGSIILACIYYCLKIFVQGVTDNGYYSIIAIYCAIVFGYKGLKMKTKLHIFSGSIWTLVAIILIISYILEIFKGAI